MKNRLVDLTTKLRWAILGGALLVVTSSMVLSLIADDKEARPNARVEVVVDNTPIDRNATRMNSFSPVVKDVSPSVVNIWTTINGKRITRQSSPLETHPFFREFFDMGPRREYRTPDQRGLGSGVIISQDGYILTNNHVVEQADEIKVTLNKDGKQYKASVVGTDPKSDVAVLKIEASGLPYAKLGDSDQIEIGDLVLAIGNPFGIGQTVTMGIVSATGRVSMGMDYEDFIQTDAAINPGNSGGALVDVQGRLLGINTAILSRTGGNNGIGFAIPINMARNIMESLIEHGRVVRGFLGVGIQDVTPNLARAFDLEESQGALVSSVTSGSAAEKAGVQDGDVIVKLNGHAVRNSQDLKNRVAMTLPGSKIEMEVNRDGKTKTLTAVLAELSDGPQLTRQGDPGQSRDEGALVGVAVDDLDTNARRQYNLPSNLRGALVVSVAPDSPAYEVGLRPGMVILAIEKQPVESASEAVDLSRKVKDPVVLLKVWNEGSTFYMVVDESNLG